MDPNLFHLDWDRLFEVLVTVIVLSFFLERALALVFEHRLYVRALDTKGLKEPIAFLLALVVCRRWHFDAVSMTILAERTSLLGEVITAAVIAGGSEASIKLFHDTMDVKSQAVRQARAEAPVRLVAGGGSGG